MEDILFEMARERENSQLPFKRFTLRNSKWKNWPLVKEALLNNENAIHQSELRTRTDLKRRLGESSFQFDVSKIFPLIPVFDVVTGEVNPLFKSRRLTPQESYHPQMPKYQSLHKNSLWGGKSVVSSLGRFKRAFGIFTKGMLEEVDLKGKKAVLLGGSVTAPLMPWSIEMEQMWRREREWMYHLIWVLKRFNVPKDLIKEIFNEVLVPVFKDLDDTLFDILVKLPKDGQKIEQYPFGESDIDIFFMCEDGDFEKSAERMRIVHEQIRNRRFDFDGEEIQNSETLRTSNTLTMVGIYPYRSIQLCLPLARNGSELAISVDIDSCGLVYDGENVFAADRFLRAMNTKYNFATLKDLSLPFLYKRICKYRERGFSAIGFEVCRHFPRCDVRFKKENYVISDGLEESINTMLMDAYQSIKIPYTPAIYTMDWVIEQLTDREFQMGGFKFIPRVIFRSKEAFKKMFMNSDQDYENLLGLRWRSWKEEGKLKQMEFYRKTCYMCGVPIHIEQLCEDCISLNLKKIDVVEDLSGKYALVTGGRTKIGFETALKLLECGCNVTITTRFPFAASRRFKFQSGSHIWWNRVQIIPVDLRDINEVLRLCTQLKESIPHLDILINNAAQTIQKPADYYVPMIKNEYKLATSMEGETLSTIQKPIYRGNNTETSTLTRFIQSPTSEESWERNICQSLQLESGVIHRSSLMTQIDSSSSKWDLRKVFPKQSVDIHGEPLDLRPLTSWNSNLEDLSTLGIVEVLIVNSLVPTLLIQNLYPLMTKTKDEPRFIVNVSSPEGYSDLRTKTNASHHVHTNMAKSSLHRLTQTVAEEFGKKGIFVTSVDPGWISIMQPLTKENENLEVVDRIAPPLTEKDGAARILDPIFRGLSKPPQQILFKGVLLRNFKIYVPQD
eukprot:TRINITY_DN7272_c0_g1_i1.p1 TRINITY_DN7272_c0_g1~~TRINITY_DN7272_c0_g1_i1.p1  ORF type:complete len:938 (+),score=175.04 TRINITY_DN7272_c0_g1_i1:120-2816(+)